MSEASYDLICTARGIFPEMCMSWTVESLNCIKEAALVVVRRPPSFNPLIPKLKK
jgi:hypothetical protein